MFGERFALALIYWPVAVEGIDADYCIGLLKGAIGGLDFPTFMKLSKSSSRLIFFFDVTLFKELPKSSSSNSSSMFL
jgi:hypothetical protein